MLGYVNAAPLLPEHPLGAYVTVLKGFALFVFRQRSLATLENVCTFPDSARWVVCGAMRLEEFSGLVDREGLLRRLRQFAKRYVGYCSV